MPEAVPGSEWPVEVPPAAEPADREVYPYAMLAAADVDALEAHWAGRQLGEAVASGRWDADRHR